MKPSFVHLRVHTEYSLVDGLLRIKPLMKHTAQAGMAAVALTDQSNLFAMVRFYKAAIEQGIKPIIGVDARVEGSTRDEGPYRLVLLCQDQRGYKNLTWLISQGYLKGQQGGQPVLARAWLEAASEGLIALSGGREGDIGRALLNGHEGAARQLADYWTGVFPGRFYLELQRTGREGEEDYLHRAVELAAATQTPVVATNDVRFLSSDEYEAHEVRVCIHEGRTLDDARRQRRYSPQQYLRAPQEMAELFADLPEALENSVEIARRCNVTLSLGENYLPQFPVPAGTTTEDYLREQAYEGLAQRLQQAGEDPTEQEAQYRVRLERELEVINSMGFPGYFLIVADFIRWAKNNGVPVGPGRGSGAGSLVAYALGITGLDPLRYDLLFERFLNPERVSMPDFDVDFCMEGRDRVIDYVGQRYGREKVSQIITYGTMAARAAVRDAGRVLGYPYGFVDRIAKLIPFKPGANISLDQALEQEVDLRETYEQDEEIRAVVDMARSIEGLARNAGKHAGGVVIAPSALTDFTPLYSEPNGEGVVSQFDKDDVEAVGLVKFDFLGLRTLTIIDRAVQIVNEQHGDSGQSPLDIEAISLHDADTFELLKRQETTAVFQLESVGMKELIKRLQPDSFEEIIALVALYRPGPLQSGMVDDFIARKHGRAEVTYPHAWLETVLKPTYGVILYQEQVMQIAQVLAGYTLGGADLLRRAMGKKKPEEMAKQRQVFIDGAEANGVARDTAAYIFDLVEKFAGYGFNKSHSAAYALLSYQTAWLKAHYPAAFMASVLSADMDNTDKVVNLIEECRAMGLQVVPPDINRSDYTFTAVGQSTILYGLGAIKGVGEAALRGLIASRDKAGPFEDLEALCRRADPQRVGRRVLEALIRAGALDGLGPSRAELLARLPEAIQKAEQHQRDSTAGQVDLFGGEAVVAVTAPRQEVVWDERDTLTAEKETLGLYLTGHPISRYESELRLFTTGSLGDVIARCEDAGEAKRSSAGGEVTVAGLIVAVRTRNTSRGRAAFVTLDDRTGRLELALFGDDYRRYSHLLVKDELLVARGSLAFDEYTGGYRLRANSVYDMAEARLRFAHHLEIGLGHPPAADGLVDELKETLAAFADGSCPVVIHYHNAQARARLRLGESWQVQPTDALLQRLARLAGADRVHLRYAS